MPDDSVWLSVAEAARKLEISPQSIRSRVARGTLQSRRNNQGQLMVLLAPDAPAVAKPALAPVNPSVDNLGHSTVKATPEPMIPLSYLDAVTARHDAALLQAEARRTSDLAQAEQRHQAELERLEKAWKSASDGLMARLTQVMLVNRPKPSIWQRLFG